MTSYLFRWPSLGPSPTFNLVDLTKLRPSHPNWANSADFVLISVTFCPDLTTPAKFGPGSTDFLASLVKLCPVSTNSCLDSAKFGRARPRFLRCCWPSFDQLWAISNEVRPASTNFAPTRANFGQDRPNLAEFGPGSARFGRTPKISAMSTRIGPTLAGSRCIGSRIRHRFHRPGAACGAHSPPKQ